MPEVQKRNRAKGRRNIGTLGKEPKKLELKVFCLSLKAHAESFVSERVISSSLSSTSAKCSDVVNINAQSKGAIEAYYMS